MNDLIRSRKPHHDLFVHSSHFALPVEVLLRIRGNINLVGTPNLLDHDWVIEFVYDHIPRQNIHNRRVVERGVCIVYRDPEFYGTWSVEAVVGVVLQQLRR